MTRPTQTRRTDRKPVVLSAQCRTASGMRDGGKITDITSNGCCVTTKSLFFQVGSRILIRPDGIEGLTGAIRWIEGMRAGVEFDNPIYDPVVEHLAANHSASVEVIS